MPPSVARLTYDYLQPAMGRFEVDELDDRDHGGFGSANQGRAIRDFEARGRWWRESDLNAFLLSILPLGKMSPPSAFT